MTCFTFADCHQQLYRSTILPRIGRPWEATVRKVHAYLLKLNAGKLLSWSSDSIDNAHSDSATLTVTKIVVTFKCI